MKNNNIKKISLVGTLIAGTALCVALPLASCSSTLEETVVPPTIVPPTIVPPTIEECANNSICWFYDYTGISPRYSFHNVVGNSTQLPESYLVLQDKITGERIRVEVTLRTLDNYLQWEQGGSPLFSCTKVVN